MLNWATTDEQLAKHSSKKEVNKERLTEYMNGIQQKLTHSFDGLSLCYHYKLMKDVKDFSRSTCVSVDFDLNKINVRASTSLNKNSYDSGLSINKSYGAQLTNEEIKKIVAYETNAHRKIIEQKITEIDEGHTPPNIES